MTIALERNGRIGSKTVKQEFAERRMRTLVVDVASLVLVLAAAACLPLSRFANELFIVAGVAWLLAMPINKLYNRHNWRCPHCDAALWGAEMRIDPVFTPKTISCMYCGSVLR